MLYKTIILELIQEKPYMYEKLRSSKMLLTMTETYASELKALHKLWMDKLTGESPQSDPRQIASEALELALLGIHDPLFSELKDEAEPPSLDGAMAYLHRHSPTAS